MLYKALLVGVLIVVAILAVSQAITVVAPYIACIVVLYVVWKLVMKDDKPPDK